MRTIIAKTSQNGHSEALSTQVVYLYLIEDKTYEIVEDVNNLTERINELMKENKKQDILISKNLYEKELNYLPVKKI